MSTTPKKEVVYQVCYALVPDEAKEDIFHSALSVLAQWENSESMEDLADAMKDLSVALRPVFQESCSLRIERIAESD